jgi:glycosyltransferase involved in cell wall biosynthesis
MFSSNEINLDENQPVIVIPAYRPDVRLPALIKELTEKSELPIILVDDGSGPEYAGIFKELKSLYGCSVCAHGQNRGKGAALKIGIREAVRLYPRASGIITADADGQHAPEDIFRVATALDDASDTLILGARDFSSETVPFKSKWGNRITASVFGCATGVRVCDTQTGLRGIPMSFAETSLNIPGERFEYEFNALLRAAEDRIPIREVTIQTIYLDENKSSNFRAVRDSVRIYTNFIKFSASSLCSAVADLSLFTLFAQCVFGGASIGILCSTVLARLLSGALNFSLNKRWVFSTRPGDGAYLLRYAALFFGQMFTSWMLVTALAALLPQFTIAKVIVDTGLFIMSYFVQKKVIFRPAKQDVTEGSVLI